ncbi:methyltransferase domain-containing protein [Arthrospira platensis SPKY2]
MDKINQNSELTNSNCQYELRWRLFYHRRWYYLRYLHLRDAFELIKDDVTSVLSVGCGLGYAESFLAIEFPHITFIVTDFRENYRVAEGFTRKFNLQNINFELYNVLEPFRRRCDLVMSIEVLEHIYDYRLAAANMRAASNKYVFCLVPFGDKEINENEAERSRVWKEHEHYCVGFDQETLEALFPNPVKTKGVYWAEYGQPFYHKQEKMTNEEAVSQMETLAKEAECDLLIDRVPVKYPEALGIWTLAKVNVI